MRIMRHVVFMWAFLCMMSPTTALSDTDNLHEKKLDENDLLDPPEVTPVPTQSVAPTSSAAPTAVPTQSPTTQSPTSDCTTDESGSYGITSTTGTTSTTVIYYYEIETATTGDIFELSAVVLPKLEDAIANKLLRVMVGDTKNCGDPDRRILSQETHGSSSRRRLDLVGLSSNPSDIVLEDCKSNYLYMYKPYFNIVHCNNISLTPPSLFVSVTSYYYHRPVSD
jgi:hypothetical protein